MPTAHLKSPLLRIYTQIASLAVCALAALPTPELRGAGSVEKVIEAPTLEQASELLNAGEYETLVSYATRAQEFDSWISEWEILKAQSLLALGRYDDAYHSLEDFVAAQRFDLQPRLLLREAALYTGRLEEAQKQKEALAYLVNERRGRYSYDPESVVAIGKIALLYDVEPKIVLENFYRRAQEFSPPPVSAFLATGDLALSKNDYKLASKAFQQGLELYPENAALWHGLAASFREGDSSLLIEYAQKALAINPRHLPTLVLLAEYQIAAESYEAATLLLDQALATNPHAPEPLALKASLAYLRNDADAGNALRKKALASWPQNPEVDYRIGRQLSRKYLFTEGAKFQRAALALDENYNPARIQLAQDLLRQGLNTEAWIHAQAVYEADPYNISAYNLETLKDRLDTFETVESEHFLMRLSKEEAPVYAARALQVLESAHARLTERYGIELPQKTTVEIYPNPADFETRTFGVPGNPGYLGVCFGPVFTINSPSTRSANWEAVLYHEFCHTITLTLSKNRMPRWLSEGISVYEEQEANAAWGQRMSAGYRDRILSKQMQPISSMSAAFLQAESGEDIQFAYYQSYLVVEFMIQEYGIEALRGLLDSLADGTEINVALAAHFEKLENLDRDFMEFAQDQAAQLATDYRFASDKGPLSSVLELINPQKNYHEALSQALDHLQEERWEQAIDELTTIVALTGYLPGAENAHWPLAQAYRRAGDPEKETRILKQIYQHEANRIAPVVRLLELSQESGDNEGIFAWSNAWLAINPMAETPWRALLESSRSTNRTPIAIEAAQALLALDAPDIPALHLQLAQFLKDSNPQLAKRHVLSALEEAPRLKAAYQLLNDLQQQLATLAEPGPLQDLNLNNDFLN